MNVVGIIAEYNPFHNGHKLQLDYAKNVLKADIIVVAMSGSFTQRGTIACSNKYNRAHMALLNGADIVLEIPTIFATASAKEYASASVKLINSLGVVDTLLFGSETDDVNLIIEGAKNVIAYEGCQEYEDIIHSYVSKGLSYPAARQMALEGVIDPNLINTPNNILAFEYTKYILENNLPLKIASIKRQGNSYNCNTLSGALSSATSIREGLIKGIDVREAMPQNAHEILQNNTVIHEDDISILLHHKLLSEDDFSIYEDCSIDLSNKINKYKHSFITFSNFCSKIKSKDLSYASISRTLCHILLGITEKEFEEAKKNGYISYIRLLGFTKNGATLLGTIKEQSSLEIYTSGNNALSKYDIISSDI